MYYTIVKTSKTILFSTENQALHLLLGIKRKCLHYHLDILDYLLLPNRLYLLIRSEGKNVENLANALGAKPMELTQANLLEHFKKLGCMGRGYALSGTYELYHSSWCFSELGKTGSKALPFSLRLVLDAKNQNRTSSGYPLQ